MREKVFVRRRHRRGNKQKKIIIFSMIGLVCLFSVGYAAFSSEFLISGKGTIVEKEEETAASMLIAKSVTTGEGLYADPVEAGRYVYRGANPNNYIWLDLNGDSSKTDNETYRIVAVEVDNAIKVVAQNSIGNIPWDTEGNRTASGYCTITYCNAWGSSSTTLDSSGNHVTVMPREVGSNTTYALPTNEASLNTYLNGTFLNGLSTKLQNKIVSHTYNIGPLNRASGQTLEADIAQESTYKWSGKIALINATDYVRASTNTSCTNVYAHSSISECYNNGATYNYLFHSADEWVLSPYSLSYSDRVWTVYSNNVMDVPNTSFGSGVWPSFYLKADINLTGEGTEGQPYTVQ